MRDHKPRGQAIPTVTMSSRTSSASSSCATGCSPRRARTSSTAPACPSCPSSTRRPGRRWAGCRWPWSPAATQHPAGAVPPRDRRSAAPLGRSGPVRRTTGRGASAHPRDDDRLPGPQAGDLPGQDGLGDRDPAQALRGVPRAGRSRPGLDRPPRSPQAYRALPDLAGRGGELQRTTSSSPSPTAPGLRVEPSVHRRVDLRFCRLPSWPSIRGAPLDHLWVQCSKHECRYLRRGPRPDSDCRIPGRRASSSNVTGIGILDQKR